MDMDEHADGIGDQTGTQTPETTPDKQNIFSSPQPTAPITTTYHPYTVLPLPLPCRRFSALSFTFDLPGYVM